MFFNETAFKGVYLVDMNKLEDERGFFARAWCEKEFMKHGLASSMVQGNVGFNRRSGTVRGMHYQVSPYAEAKLVRCTRGAIYDVIVDLRPDSSTHKQWLGVELQEKSSTMLYVPEGFAHGYQTLTDEAEIFYLTSQFFEAGAARGVRYDDPAFEIRWPLPVELISEKDRAWPNYSL